MTAFGSQQLEALNFQNLTSLSYTMPNVAMDSYWHDRRDSQLLDPRLGYQQFDSFDRILRSEYSFTASTWESTPESCSTTSIWMGSKSCADPKAFCSAATWTGGAVVVAHEGAPRTPSARLLTSGIESGPEHLFPTERSLARWFKGSSTPSSPSIATTITGWFKNLADGSTGLAPIEKTIVRPALRWTPTDALEFILRYEHGQSGRPTVPPGRTMDCIRGIPSTSPIDHTPVTRTAPWDQAFLETNWTVDFGKGKVTDIFGWRKVPDFPSDRRHRRELSRPGNWCPVNGPPHVWPPNSRRVRTSAAKSCVTRARLARPTLTTGLYYFQHNLLYLEERDPGSAPLLGLPPPFFPVILSRRRQWRLSRPRGPFASHRLGFDLRVEAQSRRPVHA